jgi:Tol biopolymer transport system component
MPALSPDGRTLAFVRFTNGLHRYDKYASDIWLMDLASRKQHVITQDESSIAANNLWAAYPSWSSDGRTLVYASDRQKLLTPPSDARDTNLAIWSMAPDGSNTAQLTYPNQLQSPGGDGDAAFRPGTKQFVFVRWAYPSASSGNPGSQLILEDATTRTAYGLTRLSGSNDSYLQPAWSPNGRRLAYVQRFGNEDHLVVATVTTSGGRTSIGDLRVLATGRLAQPSFSPDGRWVSYLQANGDDITLYALSLGSGALRTVPGIHGPIDARWRPVWTR